MVAVTHRKQSDAQINAAATTVAPATTALTRTTADEEAAGGGRGGGGDAVGEEEEEEEAGVLPSCVATLHVVAPAKFCVVRPVKPL